MQEQPLEEIAAHLGIVVRDKGPFTLAALAATINDLIVNDFSRLIAILYRMDISEKKLKSLLQANEGEEAGMIIAQLMVERQGEKIKSRESFKPRDNNIDENEKW